LGGGGGMGKGRVTEVVELTKITYTHSQWGYFKKPL
jgi:hypothetical protein